MGPPAVGRVVLVDFPYSDFSRFKKRPALIVGAADFNNSIICQITSKSFTSRLAISLSDKDFQSGGLQLDSYIRPDKLHTIDAGAAEKIIGQITAQKLAEVKRQLAKLFDI